MVGMVALSVSTGGASALGGGHGPGAGEARAVPPIGLQGGKSYTLHECCTCKHDDDIAMRDADSDDGAGGDDNDLDGDGMLCE